MHIEVRPRRKHKISLTPLIDVVFILLVFFMLASSLTDWREVTVATGVSSEPSDDEPPARISVLPDGALLFEDQRYAAAELAEQLMQRQRAGEISGVVVSPAPDTRLEPTVAALDSLAGAGLTAVALGEGH